MKKRNNLFFLVAMVIAATWSAAWAAPPAAAPSFVIPSGLPTAGDTFTYSRTGKADPFRPFIDLTVDRKKLEEEMKKKKALLESTLPLISMPIESFRLVGIAGNETKRVAIVVDPTGRFYPLTVGMIIGENRSKIVSILEKKIILEERATGRGGKARRVEWVLKSAEDEGKP
ncbi:MAG: pilus assembly protein PilP [Syntrophales bacterium]|nr:pilus assembly protein PilP [Syntrophales bacterium]